MTESQHISLEQWNKMAVEGAFDGSDWVPKQFILKWIAEGKDAANLNPDAIDIYCLFVTRYELRPLWEFIQREAKNIEIAVKSAWDIFFHVRTSLEAPDPWELLTQAEREALAKRVASMATELADLIQGSVFDELCTNLHDHAPPESTYSSVLRAAAAALSKDKAMTTRKPLNILGTLVSSQLRQLAARADALPVGWPAFGNPGTQNARDIRFIQRLHMDIAEAWGVPMYEHIASLATVFLDQDYDGEQVRQIIKRFKSRRRTSKKSSPYATP